MQITKSLNVGFEWGFGPDGKSRNFGTLGWYHPAWSITWRWVIYWSRASRFKFQFFKHNSGGWLIVPLLWAGSLSYYWQETMPRNRECPGA